MAASSEWDSAFVQCTSNILTHWKCATHLSQHRSYFYEQFLVEQSFEYLTNGNKTNCSKFYLLNLLKKQNEVHKPWLCTYERKVHLHSGDEFLLSEAMLYLLITFLRPILALIIIWKVIVLFTTVLQNKFIFINNTTGWLKKKFIVLDPFLLK